MTGVFFEFLFMEQATKKMEVIEKVTAQLRGETMLPDDVGPPVN